MRRAAVFGSIAATALLISATLDDFIPNNPNPVVQDESASTIAAPIGGAERVVKRILVENGVVETHHQTRDGVRVIGGYSTTRIDRDGQVRWVDDQIQDLSDVPEFAISPEQAVAHLSDPVMEIEPVFVALSGRPVRPAYNVLMQLSSDKRTQTNRLIDGVNGETIASRNLVHTGRAWVYPINPVETPELVQVDLPNVGATLANDRFVSGNCVDSDVCADVNPTKCRIGCDRSDPDDFSTSETAAVLMLANTASEDLLDNEIGLDRRAARNIVSYRQTYGDFESVAELDAVSYVAQTAFGKMLTYAYQESLVVGAQVHFCDVTSLAASDADGDFLHIGPVDEPAYDDAFSEVQTFHHLNRAMDRLQEMGFEGFDGPIQIITNFREADRQNPSAFECSNGAYTGNGELQEVDNAWYAPQQIDGRPALIFGQTKEVDWGLDGDIVYHELGHAVMFRIAPDVGWGVRDEYGFDSSQGGLHEGLADVAAIWMTENPVFAEYAGGGKGIRDASETFTCPDDLTGEQHDDGRILPSAFWHARESLGSEAARRDLDRAAFVIWSTLGANDTLVTTIKKLKSEFAIYRPEESDAVSELLDTFIGDRCETRVVDALSTRYINADGTNLYDLEPYGLPQTLQFSLELTSTANEIRFFADGTFEQDSDAPPSLSLFLKQGEVINWFDTVDDTYDNDANFVAVVDIDGDTATATFGGPFEPGTYYLQLSNAGGAVSFNAAGFDTDGATSGKEDAFDRNGEGSDEGCATSQPDRVPLLYLLFALFVFRVRRSKEDNNSLCV